MSIKGLLKELYWDLYLVPFVRKAQIKEWRSKYNYNKSIPTIISSNCIGGEIYHDLNLKFTSPLINTCLLDSDMVKIAKNPKYYFNHEIEFIDSSEPYPVGKIDDVTIYFVHYKTRLEAKTKWEERAKRVNYDNLYLILCDLDMTVQDVEDYQSINTVHKKIMFTKTLERKDNKDTLFIKCYYPDVYLKGYANRCKDGFYGFERFFDFVEWLND